jgi:hypothetical protein
MALLQLTSSPTFEGPIAGGAGSINVLAAAALLETLAAATR